MKKISVFLAVFGLIVLPALSQNNIALRNFKNNLKLSHANIGVCIQDMSGKEILSHNRMQSLTPASVLKIITTATALERLGKEHRFITQLAMDTLLENKLVILGYGDPTLGSEYINTVPMAFLDKWVAEIKTKVGSAAVDLEVADSYFGYKGVSRKWMREDMGNYYAAGSYGISVFDNTYKLFFNTKNSDVYPQIVKTEPYMPDILFTNDLGRNKTGEDNGYIVGEPFSNRRLLTGDIPDGRQSFSIKGDIPDPGLYLGQKLAERLQNNEITVRAVSTARSAYFKEERQLRQTLKPSIFYTHYSPPLKDIIRVVNVRSNNHYAEHLIRQVGRSKNSVDIYFDPLIEGINITLDFWKSKGIDTDGLFMYDGCGLSPSNAVNPQFICDILRYMSNESKNADAFLASFPKAGIEGTVRNLLKGTRLEGKVYVKSGSIANVQCYAGYYIEGTKKYVFAVMVNNYGKNSRREIVKAIEKLLLETL